jgi:lipopolysaccharide/colanic/teichoic acid biosynthesis glycosyltransferase
MYVLIKRSFDFSAALLLILMLSVPMAAISVLIVLFNGRPVFFVQERPGKYARLFRIYKFRTMDTLSESTDIAAHSLERVTRVGGFSGQAVLTSCPNYSIFLKGT